MTLPDFRPRWRVDLRRLSSMSGALPLAIDVLSGVPMGVPLRCRHVCSASAFAPHFAPHPLLHGNVPSPVQTACPERVMPAVWPAGCALRHAARAYHSRAVRPRKEAGQDKRSRHYVARKSSLHVGWARHAPGRAPCRVDRQRLAGLEESACLARLALTVLEGGRA